VRLNELSAFVPIDVVRDGEFSSLGLLSYDDPRLLVSFHDESAARELLENQQVSCVITRRDLADAVPPGVGLATAAVPEQAFYAAHEYLLNSTDFYGENFDSEIAAGSSIHETAIVAARNVTIGARVVIEPNAVIMERTVLGDDVVVRAGSIIGAEGFQPKRFGEALVMIPHAGGVRLRDRVEVLSGAVICRSVFGGSTDIGVETKIGVRVSISHHVRIGRRCRIGAAATILGSVVIEDDVWVGPGATISNLVHVGAGAAVTLGAIVVRNVRPGERVSGNFAIDHDAFLAEYRRRLG
jgi:UDP-3-O-[3-hydroxymyristoyl] glucosamine N-acyltransferase